MPQKWDFFKHVRNALLPRKIKPSYISCLRWVVTFELIRLKQYYQSAGRDHKKLNFVLHIVATNVRWRPSIAWCLFVTSLKIMCPESRAFILNIFCASRVCFMYFWSQYSTSYEAHLFRTVSEIFAEFSLAVLLGSTSVMSPNWKKHDMGFVCHNISHNAKTISISEYKSLLIQTHKTTFIMGEITAKKFKNCVSFNWATLSMAILTTIFLWV